MKVTFAVAVLLISALSGQAVTIDMVTVGNPGNAPDTEVMFTDGTTGYGSVDYVYQIGKYEVTAGQYTEFLNAVAKADPNGLYNFPMGSSLVPFPTNIRRTGSSPNYSYSVAADWANRPVNYVSFWDAARFANWLHNGQPTGPQGPGTTEDGAYHDVDNPTLFGRNAGARFFLPTEDEWYKAAYHNKSAGLAASYFDYSTGSNTAPINTLPDPGNHANFYDSMGTGNLFYTIGSPYYRTEVGAFSNSSSPYGTFDQGGNVWEVTETTTVNGLSGYRVYRGGAFSSNGADLGASYRYYDSSPLDENGAVGFRVASVIPEPSTLLLGTMGYVLASCLRRNRVRSR